MTKSSINRTVRQFGDEASINTVRVTVNGKTKVSKVKDPIEGSKLVPLVLGFKSMPHGEKTAVKRAFRDRLDEMAANSPRHRAIAAMAADARDIRSRKGVGRPPQIQAAA